VAWPTGRAGEKLFVDYAGQTVEVIDPETGEEHKAEIFVAVLGASNYTYAGGLLFVAIYADFIVASNTEPVQTLRVFVLQPVLFDNQVASGVQCDTLEIYVDWSFMCRFTPSSPSPRSCSGTRVSSSSPGSRSSSSARGNGGRRHDREPHEPKRIAHEPQ